MNEEDLAEILHILGTSVTKWREIGVALGLGENVLNRIEHENRDLMSCLRKMASEWLKKNYNTERFGEPTWGKLVAAVRSRAGGNNSALAHEIARKHGNYIDTLHFAFKYFFFSCLRDRNWYGDNHKCSVSVLSSASNGQF